MLIRLDRIVAPPVSHSLSTFPLCHVVLPLPALFVRPNRALDFLFAVLQHESHKRALRLCQHFHFLGSLAGI